MVAVGTADVAAPVQQNASLGVLREMIKGLAQRMMAAEMENRHIATPRT